MAEYCSGSGSYRGPMKRSHRGPRRSGITSVKGNIPYESKPEKAQRPLLASGQDLDGRTVGGVLPNFVDGVI